MPVTTKIPKTLEEALMMGYQLSEDENWSHESGTLATEFRTGELYLTNPRMEVPDLTLHVTAKLTFGKIEVRKE